MTAKKRDNRPHTLLMKRETLLPPRPTDDLSATLDRADALIHQGRSDQALKLLLPMAEKYPRQAGLQSLLGYTYTQLGDMLSALDAYERTMTLTRDANLWLPVASILATLGWYASALRAFRQALSHQPDLPMTAQIRQSIAGLEQEVANLAQQLGRPVKRVEEGLVTWERGRRALQNGDYPTCISLSQQAIAALGDWPPVLNNLSLALFYNGQPQKALAAAQKVLMQDPDNIHALCNSIHYLRWSGRQEEARALWPRLEQATPRDDDDHLKIADAAADLERDEDVLRLLRTLETRKGALFPTASVQLRLAVAEANLGQRAAAQRRLQKVVSELPYVQPMLTALKEGRPGPCWAARFPYSYSGELVPRAAMEELIDLSRRHQQTPPDRFRRSIDGLLSRFPQIFLAAEKMIWEEGQVEAGCAILFTAATPAAYATLLRFGLSQVGEDEKRMSVLSQLANAGEIPVGTTLRLWMDGKWQETQLHRTEISDQPVRQYDKVTVDLLEKAQKALSSDDNALAERVLRQILQHDPHVPEAYNNLGVIYARQEDRTRAHEMYRKALEIDPHHVHARCNLALGLLHNADVEGAIETIRPLGVLPRYRSDEMAFYSYVQARILIEQEEYDKARRQLESALQLWPDYEKAQQLLEDLEKMKKTRNVFESFWDRQHARNVAARARRQASITRPDPPLRETLALYSKDVLTGVAREVVPGGYRSTLHKAELVERICYELQSPANLERVVGGLTDDERAALRQVIERGGAMAWQEFAGCYDDDVEESPYWNWHTPKTVMGRLRLRGLLAEATVDGVLSLCVPLELRQEMTRILATP